MINKKFIVVGLVVLFIIAVAGFAWHQLQPIQEQVVDVDNRAEIVNTTESFYKEYMRAINTNENWASLIETYTSGAAKELLVARAGIFINQAKIGEQRFAEVVSPIIVRFYKISSTQIQTLVDFEMEERIIGAMPKTYTIEKLLTWEKIDDRWVIIEDYDRSDRFNEWADQQDFFAVQIIY